MENPPIFHGKIHYFYGHFPWQNVSSPEGNQRVMLVNDAIQRSHFEITKASPEIWYPDDGRYSLGLDRPPAMRLGYCICYIAVEAMAHRNR